MYVKSLVERRSMLEIKTYTNIELAEVLGGSSSRQALKKKLDRYKIEYEIIGRGNNIKFEIKRIDNPFKIYCITELGIPAQSDFETMLYFYYFYFCDDEFGCMTAEEKQEFMDKKEHYISRQTSRTWEKYLEKKQWIAFSDDECIYYFSKGGEHKVTTQEKYRKAWKMYWSMVEQGCGSGEAMLVVSSKYGGVPRKHPLPQKNAFHLGEIDDFIVLIVSEIERRMNQTINTKK